MSNKKFIVGLIFVLCAIIICFFISWSYKYLKDGNNISKTSDGITEKILKISSYKSKVEVTVTSNKNENKYVLEQKFITPNIYQQNIIEPSNIAGVKTMFDGDTLRIENSKIGTTKVYNGYKILTDNHMCLYSFVNTYKQGIESKCEENENEVIMSTKMKADNENCIAMKVLYIDKKTNKPIKMELKDVNGKTLTYIKYMEIELNNEEIFAFGVDLKNRNI